jgi:hypothetical protein
MTPLAGGAMNISCPWLAGTLHKKIPTINNKPIVLLMIPSFESLSYLVCFNCDLL